MNKTARYIAGYIIGGFVFTILLPFIFLGLSVFTGRFIRAGLINNIYIRYIISSILAAYAVIFLLWSNISLLLAGKGGPADLFNIAITPRTKFLDTKGPYSVTRNPMASGAFGLYYAESVYLNSLICLVTVTACLVIAVIYLKMTEEKRLLKDFGNSFLEYKKQTPMILPYFKIKRNS